VDEKFVDSYTVSKAIPTNIKIQNLKTFCIHSIKNSPIFFLLVSIGCFSSCSIQKKIAKSANDYILNSDDLKSAHVGISIYEPASNRYWYDFQSEKYFVPASNTKIITCYAGMKYLGDSLPGLSYTETNNDVYLLPTGDPSLLHPDYPYQPVVAFLKNNSKSISILPSNWKEEALGAGWSWDDYNGSYMVERSALPVYGNCIKFVQTHTVEQQDDLGDKSSISIYTDPEINWKLNFNTDTSSKIFSVKRNRNENIFTVTEGTEKEKAQYVPFVTNGLQSAIELLKDSIGKEIKIAAAIPPPNTVYHTIKSQPCDSLFKPMMYRSDNFFAEQTLLMVSNKLLGVMNDEKIIDSLLQTELRGFPQKPNWVDGSGLSRYNQFSPRDFVWILNNMKNEFGWKRIAAIFPAGNQGTLTNYYVSDSSFINAKTGSLSGVIALSGYLHTRKNKTLIFSVLVNNHASSGRNVRRAVEKFIQSIIAAY
jgi:D-alanyl-D-alanine carboxypeptidase/D-alanyl-D-alanine-endopeptidase (penicillin-binding protein 4)